MQIGLVGLGRMGANIARRLMRASLIITASPPLRSEGAAHG